MIIKIKAPEIRFDICYKRCIRTQQWDAVKVWNSRNVTAESVVDEHKVAATITALKKLEGLLLLYGNKKKCKSTQSLPDIRISKIKSQTCSAGNY